MQKRIKIKNIIKKNRTLFNSPNNKKVPLLGNDSLDSFLINSEMEVIDLLDNNKSLLAIYIFSLINLILFKPE